MGLVTTKDYAYDSYDDNYDYESVQVTEAEEVMYLLWFVLRSSAWLDYC